MALSMILTYLSGDFFSKLIGKSTNNISSNIDFIIDMTKENEE